MSSSPASGHPSRRRPILSSRIRWSWVISFNGRLGGGAFKVLSAIAYRAMTGTCYPSHACLMEDTGLSRTGVRKAIAALTEVQAITVSGSGGRRADGGGLSCTFRLNISPEGQVNVSPDDAQGVPQPPATCHPSEANVSLGEPQKSKEREGKKYQRDAAPIGAGGFHHADESEASAAQVDAIVKMTVRRHPGLRYVPRVVIGETVQQYPRLTCERGWSDCDRYPPEGADAVQAYGVRFRGRRGDNGWDHYRPQVQRSRPLTMTEASAWISALQEAQP
jgi:hypothetical protein